MRIGNININNNVALGPMAGVTDLPFRLLCKEQGCGILYSEMVSAKAITYKNRNTFDLMKTRQEETPIALQLFGSEPEIMAEAVRMVDELSFDMIDVNMGCPVPKVVNNGEGSALMKNPLLAEKIIDAMSQATKKPVTAKIRIGFTADNINAVEVARAVEAGGAKAVTVHGRTREQYYSGKADWNIIEQVVQAVTIPVIGNGDITKAADAVKMIETTGCEGVMVARAARGNPWIFNEINHYIKYGENLPRPSISELKEMILKHGRLAIECKGEFSAMHEMRKHVAWYTTGMPHSAALRAHVNMIEKYEDLASILERL